MQIYLDYSATTPTRPEAIALMHQIMTNSWGNPSSLHEWGQRAAITVEQARMQVASLINALPNSIVFTSGGTESNNLAIMGIARQYPQPQHIIISQVEHSAIAQPCQILEQAGWQITRLPVDHMGRIDPLSLQNALQDNTVLVSIIYGQSEVGTLQPIETLGNIARSHGVLFHTDAVQVAGKLAIDVQKLPIDFLSLSSHKIYGPQGVGALYVKPGIKLIPLLGGGGQEANLRSGTQNVAGIAGFGLASELAQSELISESARLIKLRDRLFNLLSENPYLQPTGDRLDSLPHHVSFCLVNPASIHQDRNIWQGLGEITGKTLVRQLNLAGIGISAGTACHSGKLNPSPILLAMGYSDQCALGGIRLTLGKDTTEADIDWVAMVLHQILERLVDQSKMRVNVY